MERFEILPFFRFYTFFPLSFFFFFLGASFFFFFFSVLQKKRGTAPGRPPRGARTKPREPSRAPERSHIPTEFSHTFQQKVSHKFSPTFSTRATRLRAFAHVGLRRNFFLKNQVRFERKSHDLPDAFHATAPVLGSKLGTRERVPVELEGLFSRERAAGLSHSSRYIEIDSDRDFNHPCSEILDLFHVLRMRSAGRGIREYDRTRKSSTRPAFAPSGRRGRGGGPSGASRASNARPSRRHPPEKRVK